MCGEGHACTRCYVVLRCEGAGYRACVGQAICTYVPGVTWPEIMGEGARAGVGVGVWAAEAAAETAAEEVAAAAALSEARGEPARTRTNTKHI